MNCYVLFGLVAVATVHALPLFEDDRIRSGADILLALQKAESAVRDGVTRREPIADGLRSTACDLITHAAQEPVGSVAPMRLVFAALEDANIGLSKLTCVRAYSQVTQAPLLYLSSCDVCAVTVRGMHAIDEARCGCMPHGCTDVLAIYIL